MDYEALVRLTKQIEAAHTERIIQNLIDWVVVDKQSTIYRGGFYLAIHQIRRQQEEDALNGDV
jgi:hypothetical protein